MLTETFFETFFFIFFDLFDLLIPTLPYRLPPVFLSAFLEFLETANYFVPLNLLFIFVVLSFVTDFAWIAWALLLRVKSFIPTMGN